MSNYREKMKEYLKEPENDGSNVGYGKWCALNHEQRRLIRRLLDEMDSADDYIKKIKFQLQEKEKIIEDAIEYIIKNSDENELNLYGIPKCLIFKGTIEKLLKILKGENI